MKQYRRIFVALAILMSGLALVPYISVSSEPIVWQRFADVYEPERPSLVINYPNGQPGSFFTLSGSDFPANDTATILVNGNELGSVGTDDSGDLAFTLTTSNASLGFYSVTAAVNPDASVGFLLDPAAPLRPKEGAAQEFEVPEGIALTEFVYLPVILR